MDPEAPPAVDYGKLCADLRRRLSTEGTVPAEGKFKPVTVQCLDVSMSHDLARGHRVFKANYVDGVVCKFTLEPGVEADNEAIIKVMLEGLIHG